MGGNGKRGRDRKFEKKKIKELVRMIERRVKGGTCLSSPEGGGGVMLGK